VRVAFFKGSQVSGPVIRDVMSRVVFDTTDLFIQDHELIGSFAALFWLSFFLDNSFAFLGL
jgi:hypothetical protein